MRAEEQIVTHHLPAMATIALGISLHIVLNMALVAVAQGGWRARPETVAVAAQRQPGFNYDESKVPPYTLPEVLGARRSDVRTPGAWRARRAGILGLFRDNVYGRSPGSPEHLLFAVTEDDPRAMNGAATLRRVSIKSRQGGREHEFELILFVPNAPPAPVPVFLLINNRPATNTDPTRREKSGFWPAEQLIARGYGIAALQYGQLAPDDGNRFRDGVMTLFASPSGGTPWTWGAIAAWGWGASRAMDYLVTDARVDREHVAIVGHSRGGKAALWAGAEDERFAMVISNESGEGGAALSRRWFGETVERINTSFPHWFTAAYKSFNGRESALPIDQHMLLALAAPRPLYVASADEDLWSDPRGEFLALAESSPVYALWGEPPLRAEQMPAIDRPLIVGRRGYHVRTGPHNLTPYDWDRFADFADRVWKK
jgi:hypothetical protein